MRVFVLTLILSVSAFAQTLTRVRSHDIASCSGAILKGPCDVNIAQAQCPTVWPTSTSLSINSQTPFPQTNFDRCVNQVLSSGRTVGAVQCDSNQRVVVSMGVYAQPPMYYQGPTSAKAQYAKCGCCPTGTTGGDK